MKRFLFIGIVLFAFLILIGCREACGQDFQQKGWLGVGIGMYSGSAQEMKDIYGTMTRFRASGCRDFSKNFRLEIGLAYQKKDGHPYEFIYGDVESFESSSEVSMLQSEFIAKYASRGTSADFFIGGGLVVFSFKERIEASAIIDGQYMSASDEVSKSAAGLMFIVGVDFPINETKTTVLYAELSGRSVKIEGALGDEIDIGGGVLEVGVRFNTFKK